ncbi:universal stress protein [Streptomyces sp. NPDC047928]|uniref:universal stress protein n=1 Tax=unclassified Streptomyces TaxID=2593676 RepID=UPI0037230FFA
MERAVVVGVDGSAHSDFAVYWAAAEAALRRLPLRVVHVSSLSADELAELWPYRPEPLPGHVLPDLGARFPSLRVDGVRRTGAPVAALTGEGRSAALVVLGTRGAGGFTGLPVGSVARGVAEVCPCPVVLVPGGVPGHGHVTGGPGARPGAVPAHGRPRQVALGLDVHDPVDAAVDFAFEAARRRGAVLRAVHAWRPTSPVAGRAPLPFRVPGAARATREAEETRTLADAVAPWREKYPEVTVHEEAVLLGAADALVYASARSDLLVLGRSARRLGGVADPVLGRTHCPVAIVPG